MTTTEAGTNLVLTVEEAAERLRIGRTLMFALIKDGAVESVQIGRLRRVPVGALDRFLANLQSPAVNDERAA